MCIRDSPTKSARGVAFAFSRAKRRPTPEFWRKSWIWNSGEVKPRALALEKAKATPLALLIGPLWECTYVQIWLIRINEEFSFWFPDNVHGHNPDNVLIAIHYWNKGVRCGMSEIFFAEMSWHPTFDIIISPPSQRVRTRFFLSFRRRTLASQDILDA